MSDADERGLVREQIARNYGFTPPDAFVADLMAVVDGGAADTRAFAWPTAGAPLEAWEALLTRYGVEYPEYYAIALKKFIDGLAARRETSE